MFKKITLVFAFLMSLSGAGFAAETASTAGSNDGSDDVIEAWGGTRNGGDC